MGDYVSKTSSRIQYLVFEEELEVSVLSVEEVLEDLGNSGMPGLAQTPRELKLHPISCSQGRVLIQVSLSYVQCLPKNEMLVTFNDSG